MNLEIHHGDAMRNNPINRLQRFWSRSPATELSVKQKPTWNFTVQSWEASLEALVADHPRITLAAAAAAGVLLGWMVKRR
jgi:hypothetical protein